jgi:hypothetical protein
MEETRVAQRVRADWWPRAVIAGFAAAVAMLVAYILGYGLAYLLGQAAGADAGLTGTVRGWSYNLTHNALTDLAGSGLYVVAGLHLLVAIVWAGLYARFAEPRLRGPGWRRGMNFALLPWLVSILVVLPLTGGGLLGAALGAGPLPSLGNLLLHLAYGATLGAVYGPLGDIPADSLSSAGPRDTPETTRRGEVQIAKGIGLGLAIGLLVGLAPALFDLGPSSSALGIPRAAFVLGWALLGGAFGAFLASFAALSPPR